MMPHSESESLTASGRVLRNSYFVCLDEEVFSLDSLIPDRMFLLDRNLQYFKSIFEFMEQVLKTEGLIFYLTRDPKKLPSYGPNVVVILFGDGWCRIPFYFNEVGAIYKDISTRPFLGGNLITNFSYLNSLEAVRYTRVLLLRCPSLLNYWLVSLKNKFSSQQTYLNLFDIPQGYYKQLDLPVKPMEDRTTDAFFAGSMVNLPEKPWNLKHWVRNPKEISRKSMLEVLQKIKEYMHDFTLKLKITSSFHATSDDDLMPYSEALMDTKICPVPRGSIFETLRYYEGLRYGCVVITEALPARRFYDGAPVIRVKDWKELNDIIPALLDDTSLLRQKHEESLKWWRDTCSERAVGQRMAKELNELYAQKDADLVNASQST